MIASPPSDCIVVGSGPAGVSAASALLRRGRRVLMLDAGVQLEPEREAVVSAMRQTAPAAWRTEDLELIKAGMEPGPEGIPLKRLFGSDFPYRETERFAEIECIESNVGWSHALGGFSNVWGAGVVPFTSDDISDWPIKLADLAPHYASCFEEMDLSAANDDLAPAYPLHTSQARPLRLSAAAGAFAADLGRRRAALKRAGIAFGQARLAVTAPGAAKSPGCAYCGLCLYGCPYGHIYNSAQQVRVLSEHAAFEYRGDVIVRSLAEDRGGVTLQAHDRTTGAEYRYTARQVLLACGVIPTTALLLDSLGLYDESVEVKDSQYFLLPLLRARGTADVTQEKLHTLAQLFLEIADPALSAKGIHLSVYSYNDLMLAALRQQLGPVARVLPWLPVALAGRMLVCGGYLHSNESPSLHLRLTRGPDGRRRLVLKGERRPESERILRKLMRKLLRHSLHFRALPLVPLLKRGLPGRGYHIGGTFPMTARPARLQSDTACRPAGFRRVYLADATAFPSVPAPNLTLTVMANARRVAHAACEA